MESTTSYTFPMQTRAGQTELPKFQTEVAAAGLEPRITRSPVQRSNPLGHSPLHNIFTGTAYTELKTCNFPTTNRLPRHACHSLESRRVPGKGDTIRSKYQVYSRDWKIWKMYLGFCLNKLEGKGNIWKTGSNTCDLVTGTEEIAGEFGCWGKSIT